MSDLSTALPIPTKLIPTTWHLARDYIARCDQGKSTADSLYGKLCDGSRHLWLTLKGGEVKGACISYIESGFEPTLVITTLGGDGLDWDACLLQVEKMARVWGCTQIRIQGRRGWLRRLTGYKEKYIVIGKELCESD